MLEVIFLDGPCLKIKTQKEQQKKKKECQYKQQYNKTTKQPQNTIYSFVHLQYNFRCFNICSGQQTNFMC